MIRFGHTFFAGSAIATILALPLASPALAVEIAENGSFETLNGPFVDNGFNYMALGNGSTFITNWTVSTSIGAIVLGKTPTGDGFSAAAGTFFIDLSGFGNSSPDGAVNQTLSTVGGAVYAFSMDVGSGNNGVILVTVGGHPLVLTAGTPFTVGSTSWTPETGSFIGDPLDTTPVLTVMDGTPGSTLDFVDNISITTAASAVPEPSGLTIVLAALSGLAVWRRKKAAAAN